MLRGSRHPSRPTNSRRSIIWPTTSSGMWEAIASGLGPMRVEKTHSTTLPADTRHLGQRRTCSGARGGFRFGTRRFERRVEVCADLPCEGRQGHRSLGDGRKRRDRRPISRRSLRIGTSERGIASSTIAYEFLWQRLRAAVILKVISGELAGGWRCRVAGCRLPGRKEVACGHL